MTIQEYWLGFASFLNASALYLVMLLGRSAMLSLPVLLAILLLRRTVFRKTVFLKGMLWGLFFPLPFIGKMRFFYESSLGIRCFIWWHNLCINHDWINWLYLMGIAVFGIYILYRRRKLYRFAAGLRREQIGGTEIVICDRAVTPFTTGVCRPRIVVPEIIRRNFCPKELELILLHEKTHIRLGHLWFYALWDILRILLWVNPLLTICAKYLREDMEEICDRVVIQRSRATAYDYGKLLLNSLRILGEETIDTPAAFAGEREYQSIKNRMVQVAYFKPYGKYTAVIGTVSCVLILIGIFFSIRQFSYPIYTDRMDISIYDRGVQSWELGSQSQLRDVISIDDGFVCIRQDAWNQVLKEQGIEEEGYYISFGGYLKLPGVGGGGNAVYVEPGAEKELLVLPYFNNDKVIWTRLFKLL